jgi:hypothetical protein
LLERIVAILEHWEHFLINPQERTFPGLRINLKGFAMTPCEGVTRMLRVAPSSWFSWNFVVFEGQDQVADIRLAVLREAGELIVRDKTYRVNREGIMSGAFILRDGELELARAEKPSAFYRSFQVTHDGRCYTLGAESTLRRKFVLQENGRTVGSVCPVNAFTRKCDADLPTGISLPVRVFMIWLVILLWKRDSDTAAVAAG